MDSLRQVLGVPDLDAGLLKHALTHRSYAYENGQVPNNERLEFLGDSVLGLVVTDALFTNHPDLAEGQLAKMRAAVVSAKALAVVATPSASANTSFSVAVRKPPADARRPPYFPTRSKP